MHVPDHNANPPLFQRIEDHVVGQIAAGAWGPGAMIPTEQELGAQFGAARMTVNRAVRELADAGVLVRQQGRGTFVAQPAQPDARIDIRHIATEIAAGGHVHRSSLRLLEHKRAPAQIADQFGAGLRSPLFHAVLVHFDGETPLQVEDRWVNPACAPAFMAQDFASILPADYLASVMPLQGASFSIDADIAPRDIAAMLGLDGRQPCLVQRRQSYMGAQVISVATLWYPKHYQFSGTVAPAVRVP